MMFHVKHNRNRRERDRSIQSDDVNVSRETKKNKLG